MKSGIQTTEFWVTILTDVGVVATALQGALPAKWAALAVAVANVAYAVSRGLTKSGYTPPAPVVVVDPGPHPQPLDAAT